MRKKLFILSICTVFAIVAVSFATAANIQKEDNKKERISPLYNIRTSMAIGEKTQLIKNYLKDKLSQRFFIPGNYIQNEEKEETGKTNYVTCFPRPTCFPYPSCAKCNLNQAYEQNEYEEEMGHTNYRNCISIILWCK